MTLTLQAPESEREIIPVGLHSAILVWIVDLGTQETQWGDKLQMQFTFELPNIVREFDGKEEPAIISTMPLTPWITPKSNITRLLQGWLGKMPEPGFDVKRLSGKHCKVNIVHELSKDGTKTYANIAGIVPADENDKKLTPYNPVIVYEIMNGSIPQELPEWIRIKIMKSKEFNGPDVEDIHTPTDREDVPF